MEHDPLNVWMMIFGALLTWKLGALLLLHPAVRRSEYHSPWWLFAPVLWPTVWPIWLWVLWRERRYAKAYETLPRPVDPNSFVRLVPQGRPYGSPIPSGGQLAREIKQPPTYMVG